MGDTKKDGSTLGGRDPAEGPAEPAQGAPKIHAPAENHLGPAGDPSEGAPSFEP